MDYITCIREIKKQVFHTDAGISAILQYLEQEQEFTPLQVANKFQVGYAGTVAIIDILYELGYTDWPGFITPSRKAIKVLAIPRTKQELQKHKVTWQ